MNLRTSSLIALLSVVAAAPVFGADKTSAKKITYQEHVLPILREKCLACHDSDKMKGGLDMTTFTKLMEGGGSGAVVKPGDPDGSRLYATVAHKSQPFMPPKSDKIAEASVNTIRDWIQAGALENSGSKAVVMKPKTDVGLTSVVRGRPPVMPLPTVMLNRDPVVTTARLDAVIAMASSPWAPLLAIGGQKQVLLYNTDTLELIGVLPFPYGKPNVVKFSRNGSLLLAGGGRGGQSGKVVVWSVLNGEKIIEVGDETDAVLAADISADQTQIALGGPNKMIRVYSTKDGEKIREIKKHTDWITAVEFSPDGVLLGTGDRNGGLFVWEAYTGREYFSLRGHTGAITEINWRDDSNVMVSASEDTTVRLWEMENGGQIRSIGAHGGGTQSARFTHDNRIVTTGRDRVLKIWDQNGAQQRAFEAFPDIGLQAAATHDVSRVIGSDWTGLVRLFMVADGKPAGVVSPNPPSIADQFEAAMKDLMEKSAAYDQAKAAVDGATANLQKANSELAAAQKAVTDTTAAFKAAEAALVQSRAQMESAKAAIAPAQAKVTAKDLTLKAYSEASAKIKASADAAKNDPALVAEYQASQKLVAQTQAELDAAKKGMTDATNTMNAMAAKAAADEKNLVAMKANMEAAAKGVEPKTVAVKTATDQLTAAQNGFNAAAQAVLNASKTLVDRYKSMPPKK